MTKQDQLAGCIIGGAIGDAWGSIHETATVKQEAATFYLGRVPVAKPSWMFTDDTQLTLATLEALLVTDKLSPAKLAESFTAYYRRGMLTGLGASTLQALRELEAGGHWSQVGRSGEYGAGNGAAMRIAPVAFWEQYERADIYDFCRITHRNEEAYVGALAVVLAIRAILTKQWTGGPNLLELLITQLPYTRTRDRLLELDALPHTSSIADAAKLGTSGYVVDSVPFALFCAARVPQLDLTEMYKAIIAAGGDTDTNASIAGQVAGTLLGLSQIPTELKVSLQKVPGYDWLARVMHDAQAKVA